MRSGIYRLTAFTIVIAAFATTAIAQPLLDRVPDDAIVYLGWRGAADVGPGYEESHLKAVLEASRAKELASNLLPKLAKRMAVEDAAAAEKIELVWAMAQPLWRHPTALYFGGVDTTKPEASDLKIALLCDAGDDAATLLETFKTAIAEAPESNVKLSAKQFGNVVVLATYTFSDKPEAALAGNKNFAAALSKTSKDAVVTMYVEHEKLLDFVDLAVGTSGGEEAQQYWPQARKVLQLDRIKRLIWTSGFDGAEWADTMWIEAPGPREGLLAALEGKPISDETLKAIPQDSTHVTVAQLDLGVLLAETRKAIVALDPDIAEQFEKGVSAASLAVGANVETELINQLGSQWTTYASPSIGGRSALGRVLINHPKDAAKVERTLGLVEIAINNTIAGQLKGPRQPKIRFERAKLNGLNLHYWAVPMISPAWAMKDGAMYAGAFPQTVVSAAGRASNAEGGSILDNAKFQELSKRFGGGEIHSLNFVDLPEIAPDGYASLLMIARLPLGLGDIFGVSTPPMVVPPFEQIRPHLTPIGSVSRVDDAGFWFKSFSPFPGAGILGMQDQGLIFQQMMLPGALMSGIQQSRMAATIQPGAVEDAEPPMEVTGEPEAPSAPPDRPLRPRPGPRSDDAQP
ncbi:MAG: hypothetical protein H0T11_03585 [Chthoniobacterales bacterium]|nr:hypothetical protein [Chthoniobacterales bacterium]